MSLMVYIVRVPRVYLPTQTIHADALKAYGTLNPFSIIFLSFFCSQ